MIRVGDYLLPYDPAPVIEKYEPIFEHLAQEVDQFREVWDGIAPLWRPRLKELLTEEGLEIQNNEALAGKYGIELSRSYIRFIIDEDFYGPDCIPRLLARKARCPEDLDHIAERLRDVIQRFRRAVDRMKEEAARTWSLTAIEERKITP